MLAAGATVAGYRIDGVLGHGGMGVVYAAEQLSLARPVALKILAADVTGAAARERFRREAEAQAGLDHPHVVTVYEAGEAPDGLFIAMRLIRGGTLRDAMAEPMAPAAVLGLLAPIADALDAAHAAGLVHRDVKPRNILLDDGGAYLADFGLVKQLDGVTLTDPGGFLGTPDYVAPEQVRGEPTGAAADIYAFAAVLYHCLTGTVVFEAETVEAALHAHTHDDPTPPSRRRSGLPAALDAPLLRGLAKDPAQRPPTANALIGELEAGLAGRPRVAGAQRRPVAVVCAGFPAPDDPELRHDILRQARERSAAIAERHGGTLRPGTDPVLIVFGLERLHEDDAARAVRAGEELREAGASVGVDSGLVFADGDDVTGQPLRSAHALQLAAADGELRLGDEAQRLIAPPARRSPFVGRAGELGALRAAVDDQDIHLVTLVGPAGIGKSRLIEELDRPVLAGRCAPYGEALTYAPFAEMLGELPTGRPEEVALAVRRGLAERGAVVAVIEDLHLADPALLEVIDDVATFSGTVTLVCSARPDLLDARPAWAVPQAGRALIAVGPLAEHDALRMAGAGAEALVATAEGNPFFLEQLLAVGDAATVPPSIQAVLATRLDQLGPVERDVLERAAVIGRSFPAAALDDHAALLELAHAGLIRSGPDEALQFAHALIREVAYEGLARGRRAELHGEAARWFDGDDALAGHHLERVHAYRPDPSVAAAAATRLSRAAEAARARGDMAAAVGLLERAIALRDRDPHLLPDLAATLFDAGRLADAAAVAAEALQAAAGDGELEARARIEQHLVALHAGSAEGTEAAARTALRATQLLTGRDAARAWRLLAWTHWIEGRAADAEVAWQRAAPLADPHERIEILGWSASAAAYGPLPVPTAIRRCEAIADEVGDSPLATALIQRSLALLHALGGDVDTARRLVAEGNAVLDELVRLHWSISHQEAQVELVAGAPDRAERRLRADYARLEDIGEHALLATTAGLLAQALAAQGRWDEALEVCAVSRQEADPTDRITQALWRGVQARALARSGASPDAEALAREAVALLAPTDALVDRGDAQLALASVLVAAGRGAEADAAAAKAADLYARKGATALAARPPT